MPRGPRRTRTVRAQVLRACNPRGDRDAEGGVALAVFQVMKCSALACAVVVAGCGTYATPPSELPWLYGFRSVAVADAPTETAARHAAQLGAADDATYGALELRADLTGDGEPELVVASYALGIVVLDGRDRTIAKRGRYEPAGSADTIVALGIGDAGLATPVLAVAVQTGGHRESTVVLSLYRIGERGALLPVFVQPIEEHDGDAVQTGMIVFSPARLTYRAPSSGTPVSFVFDPARGRYLAQPAPPPPLD